VVAARWPAAERVGVGSYGRRLGAGAISRMTKARAVAAHKATVSDGYRGDMTVSRRDGGCRPRLPGESTCHGRVRASQQLDRIRRQVR